MLRACAPYRARARPFASAWRGELPLRALRCHCARFAAWPAGSCLQLLQLPAADTFSYYLPHVPRQPSRGVRLDRFVANARVGA